MSEFAPSLVRVLKLEKEDLEILVVARSFQGQTLKRRFDLAWARMENNASELVEGYLLSFQLYSENEFQDLVASGQFSSDGSPTTSGAGQAARSVLIDSASS